MPCHRFDSFLRANSTAFDRTGYAPYTGGMEVHFKPETESRLNELASASGRPADDLMEDAMAGYLLELAQVREMLDGRYDDLKSGRVKPVDGEEAFAKLRQKSKERRAGS